MYVKYGLYKSIKTFRLRQSNLLMYFYSFATELNNLCVNLNPDFCWRFPCIYFSAYGPRQCFARGSNIFFFVNYNICDEIYMCTERKHFFEQMKTTGVFLFSVHIVGGKSLLG